MPQTTFENTPQNALKRLNYWSDYSCMSDNCPKSVASMRFLAIAGVSRRFMSHTHSDP